MKIKIDINLPSNEYFPKSINTKPKNNQPGQQLQRPDRQRNRETNRETEKQRNRETDIENYNIDSHII